MSGDYKSIKQENLQSETGFNRDLICSKYRVTVVDILEHYNVLVIT